MEARLVDKISDISELAKRLAGASERVGAICIFLGVVRGESSGKKVLRLEYEAHEELAPKILLKILEEAKNKHGIIDGLVEHKIGSAEVGEPVMCVMIASRRREEGFRALMEVVDRVKHEAPIWKKEVTEEGSYWVEPEP